MSPRAPSRALLVSALALAVIAISFAAILFRAAPELHPLSAAGWRLVIAGLVLGPFVRHLPPGALGAGVIAGLAYAVHFGSWVASLGLVSVLISVTIVTTTPLVLALLGLVTGRDRPDARTLGGLALGAVGVVMLALSSRGGDHADTSLYGVLLALLGALAMAAYLLVARRVTRAPSDGGVHPIRASLALSGIAALVGGAALVLTAGLSGARILPANAHEAWVVIGAAALPQLVGHTLLTWALTRTTPTVVALTTLGEPVGAALLAWVFLSEPLTPIGTLACALTLSGVAAALSPRGQPRAAAGS